MSKTTPEQQIDECCKRIKEEIDHWKDTNEYGCHDPFWPDGCNMNLVRNHIIYYRRKIEELCRIHDVRLPSEYYLPVPPEVDNEYMASMKQKERVQRLKQSGNNLTNKKVKYDDFQLALFW